VPKLRVYPGHALLLAFGAVALSFTASTFFSEIADFRIESAAHDIATNTSPRVIRLAALRTELRQLEEAAIDLVRRPEGGAPRSEELTALDQSARRIIQAWTAYEVMPHEVPAEQVARASIDQAMPSLPPGVDRLIAALSSRDRVSAQEILAQEIRPLTDHLTSQLMTIIDINAREAARLAETIHELGQRSIRASVALDALSVFLTIVAGLVALRTVRRYTRLLGERAEELEMFSGRVAHDILAPLNAVSISLGLVERLGARESKILEATARGQSGLQRVKRIVDGLLAFARAGAHPEAGACADVHAVIDDVLGEIEPMATQAGITLRVEGTAHAYAAISAGALTSLCENLTRNAVKYMGDARERRVTVRTLLRERCVRVEVEDTGPGLSAEMASRVFEPYVRGGAEKPGIGLGLATVKRIAEGHGGKVGVQSRPGAGATFWFELPSAPPRNPAVEPAPAPSGQPERPRSGPLEPPLNSPRAS
jgi:signal transduction histidine kinase